MVEGIGHFHQYNPGVAEPICSPSKVPNLWQRLYIYTFRGGVALAWGMFRVQRQFW